MAETIARLIREGLIPHERILVLAHTRPLVDQLLQAFWHQLPKEISTHRLAEQEFPAYWKGITFATIQSVSNNLDRLPEFGLILVDEAHHIGAPTFREAIEALRPQMLAGATATDANAKEKEKCYGVVKAGKNDCANAAGTHSCAGSAATDADGGEWVYVPKGLCNKLVGGSPEPK